jgi:pilus assembly protein FimV
MFKRNFCPALVLALLFPAATLALGLGDIHLKSSLNAPLDAEIDLVGASADDLASLKATLATRDSFTRGGLDYPGFLGALSFVPEKTADGRNVLHVHSADVANEPFATLLVEVDWARGHVVREYTVLIDPPVFSGAQAPASAAVAAPSAGSSARSGAVEHRAAAAPSAAESAPAASAATTSSSAESVAAAPASSAPANSNRSGGAHAATSRYTVRPGDTLTAVASQAYPGADRHLRERQLVAIYRANPAAFLGNMNVLLSGSRLDIPGDTDIDAISPGDASSEVRRQYAAWAGTHGGATAARAGNGEPASGQLHLVPPQEAAKTPASAPNTAPAAPSANAGAPGGGGNNAALTQRVQQLEAQLAESQRLLQLRNADLAAMQARAAQAATNNAAPPGPTVAPKPTPPAAAPTPVPTPPPAVSAPANNPPAAAAPSPTVTPTPTPPPPAAKPSTAPAANAESGNSVLDLIEQYWYVPAGLIAILIILVVLRFVRARQEDEFDRSLGRLQPSFETSGSEAARASDTVPVRTLPSSGADTSYRVEESGPHEQPSFDHHPALDAGSTATSQHVAIDDTVTGERPVALDQGDPLAEADFHMAYGLYDQAADLVQIAISREPNRRELKLKLLEVFFVWGNKDRFLQTARELAGSRPQALAGEWEKMVIMGRQIAPEDPLFANAGTLTGAASGGVDLNLEGGQNRVDFDLLGEPSVAGAGAETGAGLDLDLGAALGDGDITGQVNKVGDDGVDFVLDDPERGNDSTGSTREMPGAPAVNTREMPAVPGAAGTAAVREFTATTRVASGPAADAEAPTVEQPQLPGGENATIREKIGAAARSGMQTSDQTAELALDDLGLDLGALEGLGDETGISNTADAPTLLSNLDEDTRELLARARAEHSDSDATQRAPTGDGPSDSGTWLFTDTDFANGMAREAGKAASAESDAPTQLVTQISPQLPADMDTASTSSLEALDVSSLDLDVGSLGEESAVNGIDLDVGTPSVSEGTFVQTQKIASGDMALPELEPATMSEVGTKLDLARAYMDMGDPEGARSILSEVLSEGSVSQKQEARRLMDTLPG